MGSSTRTEQVWVQQHKNLSWLCHLSKNLYNEGNYQIRQELFKHNKWIRYNALYHRIKTSKNYKQLPTQTAQQGLKILDRNWKAFFSSIKTWKKDKSKFKGRPKPPGYKSKNGELMLVFTNQQVKLKNSLLRFPTKVSLK